MDIVVYCAVLMLCVWIMYRNTRARAYRRAVAWVAITIGCTYGFLLYQEVVKDVFSLQFVKFGFYASGMYCLAVLALDHLPIEKLSKTLSSFRRLSAWAALAAVVTLSLYRSDWLVVLAAASGFATCYIVGKVIPPKQTRVIRPELVNLRTDTEDMECLGRIRATNATAIKPRH